jgi:hypothetical protein
MKRRRIKNRYRLEHEKFEYKRETPMKIHSTANTHNIQLSAGSRFLRRMVPVAIAIGLVAIAALSLSRTVTASGAQNPQGPDGHAACTLATLQGRYLFADSGVLLPPAFGVTQPTLAADAGVHIFNGDGTGTDTVTFRIGTEIVLENVVAPIFYTVNADCTGRVTVANGPSFDLFIAPDGAEFASISTAPGGNYPASISRRVARR